MLMYLSSNLSLAFSSIFPLLSKGGGSSGCDGRERHQPWKSTEVTFDKWNLTPSNSPRPLTRVYLNPLPCRDPGQVIPDGGSAPGIP